MKVSMILVAVAALAGTHAVVAQPIGSFNTDSQAVSTESAAPPAEQPQGDTLLGDSTVSGAPLEDPLITSPTGTDPIDAQAAGDEASDPLGANMAHDIMLTIFNQAGDKEIVRISKDTQTMSASDDDVYLYPANNAAYYGPREVFGNNAAGVTIWNYPYPYYPGVDGLYCIVKAENPAMGYPYVIVQCGDDKHEFKNYYINTNHAIHVGECKMVTDTYGHNYGKYCREEDAADDGMKMISFYIYGSDNSTSQ